MRSCTITCAPWGGTTVIRAQAAALGRRAQSIMRDGEPASETIRDDFLAPIFVVRGLGYAPESAQSLLKTAEEVAQEMLRA